MEDRHYNPFNKGEHLPKTPQASEAIPDFEKPALKVPEKVRAAELTLLAAKKQPEAKLAHVTEAANRNEPVERLYELRHEVKDQAAPQAAVAVGDVVADISSRQPGLAGLSPLSAGQTQDPGPATDDSDIQPVPPARSLYRRAVGRGFTAALGILLCIEIFMLING